MAYAEKTMSALLRLHDELVEEKEKRIDLYRRLMDREQQLAEIRSYVQLLETELSRQGELSAGARAPRPAGDLPQGRAEGLPAPRALQGGSAAGPVRRDPARPEEGGQPQGGAEVSPGPQGAGENTGENGGGGRGMPSGGSSGAAAGRPKSGPAPTVAWVPANANSRGGSG